MSSRSSRMDKAHEAASLGHFAFSSHVGMASIGEAVTLGMPVTLAATELRLPALYKHQANR